MDQRTANRLREHKDHGGWEKIRDGHPTCFNYEPAALMLCSCGWLGWIKVENIFLPGDQD